MKRFLYPTLISILILSLGIIGILFLIPQDPEDFPGLSDWADAVGTIIATISFVWLIAAQIDDSIKIQQNQKEIEQTNKRIEDILSYISSISENLGRSAVAQETQADAVISSLTAKFSVSGRNPEKSNMGKAISTRPQGIEYQIKNEGTSVKIHNIEIISGDVDAAISRRTPFDCLPNHSFPVSITASKPLKNSGGFAFVIRYKTTSGTDNAKKFEFDRYDADPQITDFQDNSEPD